VEILRTHSLTVVALIPPDNAFPSRISRPVRNDMVALCPYDQIDAAKLIRTLLNLFELAML